MADWVTITVDDVKARLSEPELRAVQSYDLASGQSDPTDVAIALALAEVRGYVPANCRNPTPTLVPPELQDTTIIVAIEKLAGRLSGGGCIMEENRQRAFEFAIQRLRDTARGAYHISAGSTGEVTQTASSDGESVQGGNGVLCYGGEAKLDF